MKNKWIHFSIDRESLIGMLSGVGIVILSVIMTIFNNDIANIILRDILMILMQEWTSIILRIIFADKHIRRPMNSI